MKLLVKLSRKGIHQFLLKDEAWVALMLKTLPSLGVDLKILTELEEHGCRITP